MECVTRGKMRKLCLSHSIRYGIAGSAWVSFLVGWVLGWMGMLGVFCRLAVESFCVFGGVRRASEQRPRDWRPACAGRDLSRLSPDRVSFSGIGGCEVRPCVVVVDRRARVAAGRARRGRGRGRLSAAKLKAKILHIYAILIPLENCYAHLKNRTHRAAQDPGRDGTHGDTDITSRAHVQRLTYTGRQESAVVESEYREAAEPES